MKRFLVRGLAVAAAGLGLLAAASPALGQAGDDDANPSASSSGQTLIGLTSGDRLVMFDAENPRVITRQVSVRGLDRREDLIGVDRRPATGDLYGVATSRRGANLYIINPQSGRATFVAQLVAAPTATSPRGGKIMLDGDNFGFDFNPAADALRIVSDTGQNLRVLPSDRVINGVQIKTGDTVTDGTLNRAGVVATDVTAVAYLNNDNDPATGTTLFDIDSGRDELNMQNPPNDGTLVLVGKTGLRTRALAGFDIVTQGGVNTAYAALSKGDGRDGVTRIVQIDPDTGFIRLLGTLDIDGQLKGLAA
jgi:hypothetical protein